MHLSPQLLLELGAILLVLATLGALARRAGFSPIPLYLAVGLAIGEGGLPPDPAVEEFIQTGATIGVVLLLLVLGLQFSVAEFGHSLRRHMPSAALDLVLNAVPGAVAGWLLGFNPIGILALAGATYISSSGIIARLLADLGRLANRETPSVLSVLVLEDFAMAAYLPLLAVLAAGDGWEQALVSMLVAGAALVFAFWVSLRWGQHVGRLVWHPQPEQLMLRVLGVTLVIAAVAEFLHVSAAVGAFLFGLTLRSNTARRSREVLAPLRDLFAAVFFVAIGFSVSPADLLPMLPAAVVLAVVTAGTKMATGWFAASRDGASRPGQLRAGAVLTVRGEFSLVIVGLAATADPELAPLVAAYVFLLAVGGPVLAKYVGVRR